jgi:cytochrome c oxidase cbb3-type subunit 3
VTAIRMLALVALPLALSSCDRPPPADSLREWTPADHHSTDDDKQAARAPQGARTDQGSEQSPGPPGASDVSQLVDITWRQQCSACHGSVGKGDGQLGPMVHAPDLTLEDWQSKASDAEIAAVIKNGKGKMPKFDVPEPVIEGLVARVRAARGR